MPQRLARTTLRLGLILGLAGCSNDAGKPAPGASPGAGAPAGAAETSSPADSPMKYTVLSDQLDGKSNAVEFHLLVAEGPKHDDVEKLLKYLYRHLMLRREPQPTAISVAVYSNEAQYRTPPRTPIATLQQRAGEIHPVFENKVPLEFWQQIEVALFGEDEKERAAHLDQNKHAKLAMKIERDDAKKTLALTVPYTESGKDEWSETLSFNQAMNIFTNLAQGIFENVPELAQLTYVGTWSSACKDHAPTCPPEDVVKISLDRDAYRSLKLGDVEESMGRIHGRAYAEMSANRGSDAAISKANTARMAAVYKKMLAQLKGRAWVSPKLK